MTGLWDWATEVYARPGVEAALLALQDQHAQGVSYLLWAAWMADEGRGVSEAIMGQAAETARRWEEAVVAPLRQARRALTDPAHRSLRDQVLAAELAAERALLESLESLPPAAGGSDAPDLQAAARAWGRPVPAADIAALAGLLG